MTAAAPIDSPRGRPSGPHAANALSPEAAWQKKVRALGLVLLICGGGYALVCVQHAASQYLTGPLLEMYFAWLQSMAPGAKVATMLVPIQEFTSRIALAETLRMIPFFGCSVWLFLIGLRLRRYDRAAFKTLRTWTYVAFGVLAISVAIQALVTLPASLAYMEGLTKSMPAMPPAGSRGAPPFDMKEMMGLIMTAATGAGIVMGAVFMAVLPAVLIWWGGKLDREAPPTAIATS